LTGDQTQDGVLVLEPKKDGHEATIYLLPRSDPGVPAGTRGRRAGRVDREVRPVRRPHRSYGDGGR
ncbi:hypothetical protein, partial [Streptomyces sp. NPDC001809]